MSIVSSSIRYFLDLCTLLGKQLAKMAAFFRIKLFNLAEDEITFESFVKFPITILKVLIFNFRSENSSQTWKSKTLLRKTYNIFVVLALLVANFQLVAYDFVHSENFLDAASGIANASSGLLIIVKYFVTFTRKDDIRKILEELKEIYVSRESENTNCKVKKYLDGYLRVGKAFCMMSSFIFLSVLIQPLLTYLQSGELRPSFNYWLPLELSPSDVRVFAILSLWGNYICYICTTSQLATDSLLYAIITIISMEFDFLKISFANLKLKTEVRKNRKVASLIDRHNKLLKLSDDLQGVYGPIFLFSFFISSVIACLILFHLSTAQSNDTANSFFFPFLFLMGGQILLLCIFGQKLINSSAGIAEGIYNCDWITSEDNQRKKHVALILIRAQRPQQLTTMKFTKVSLESYKNVRLLD